jgi:opacity protein-like surface antigen
MKNAIVALALATMTTAAVAADVPGRNAPLPPVRPNFETTMTGFYAGANAGASWYSGDAKALAGVTVGYEFNPFLRAEINGLSRFGSQDGQSVTVDGILGVPVGRFTPYALVGVGVGFNSFNDSRRDADALWSVGGGVRYSVTQNWELDARYRYLQNFDNTLRDNNITTLGVNYKF